MAVKPSLLNLLLSSKPTQATEVDPRRDAEPGKILHEARQSEMAVLGEVPYHRYYGSVDSTPLFVLLAAMYFKRTEDRELLTRLWLILKERCIG
jgi:glycogen debranching enzyme